MQQLAALQQAQVGQRIEQKRIGREAELRIAVWRIEPGKRRILGCHGPAQPRQVLAIDPLDGVLAEPPDCERQHLEHDLGRIADVGKQDLLLNANYSITIHVVANGCTDANGHAPRPA